MSFKTLGYNFYTRPIKYTVHFLILVHQLALADILRSATLHGSIHPTFGLLSSALEVSIHLDPRIDQ